MDEIENLALQIHARIDGGKKGPHFEFHISIMWTPLPNEQIKKAPKMLHWRPKKGGKKGRVKMATQQALPLKERKKEGRKKEEKNSALLPHERERERRNKKEEEPKVKFSGIFFRSKELIFQPRTM